MENKGEIIIYKNKDNNISLNVRLEDENVWLTQQQMAELFQTSRTNIVEHIKHIFEEGELDKTATCRNFRQVQIEGNRNVERELPFYNLDLIISLGYRIKSKIATQFRIWATQRLKEYIVKGFTMDDERLKNIGGGGYWHELLNRIRDIRLKAKDGDFFISDWLRNRNTLEYIGIWEQINNPGFNYGEFAAIRKISIQQMTILAEVQGRKLLK